MKNVLVFSRSYVLNFFHVYYSNEMNLGVNIRISVFFDFSLFPFSLTFFVGIS